MKSVLIIGVGEFGRNLAENLVELKNEVRLIDKSESVINSLPSYFDDAMIGDCCNINVVSQLGVADYDICVVAVGENFQDSLEITSNLKECGAKYIISQCHSDIQGKFLKMAGAAKTVYAQKEAAEKVAFLCNGDNLIDYISISDDYKILKVQLPAKWEGHTMPELQLRDKYGFNVLAIEKDDKVTIPNAAYVFKKGDHVLILGKEKDLFKLAK